jgi:hypothetical protein
LKKGFGKYYYKSGNIYEGTWLNDLKHGDGRYFDFATKEIYEGQF